MDLVDKIRKDMQEAMKGKEKEKLTARRMLLAEIKNAEIKKREELKEEDILQVIATAVKRRKESIVEFEKGNRPDLVEKEKKEMEVLTAYLPEQLSEEEIRSIIKDAIENIQAIGLKDLGKVMGQVMPKVKGRADGRRVNEIAREMLS